MPQRHAFDLGGSGCKEVLTYAKCCGGQCTDRVAGARTPCDGLSAVVAELHSSRDARLQRAHLPANPLIRPPPIRRERGQDVRVPLQRARLPTNPPRTSLSTASALDPPPPPPLKSPSSTHFRQAAHLGSGRGVPDLHELVKRAADDALPVRRESERADHHRVPVQLKALLPTHPLISPPPRQESFL